MSGMTTIKDVAKIAGVSCATVSRVLLHPEIVTEKTRTRVMKVVRKLGYTPHPAAASLRTTRTKKIIVTVPNIANTFFSSVISGVEQAAQKAGYSVLLGDTREEPEREERYASMLLQHEADGLIFLGHRLPKILVSEVEEKKGRAPIVNGCEFSSDLKVSSAHIDNYSAARAAMAALYEMGHREIALFTGPLDSPLSRDRLEGAQAEAHSRGLARHVHLLQGNFTMESGKMLATDLFARKTKVTALFCFSDEMAIGALAGLRDAGLSCPTDMSIIGFDDIPLARFVDPQLTTVRQPMELIGRRTVDLLLDIITGRNLEPVSETLPHELVLRGSSAPPKHSL